MKFTDKLNARPYLYRVLGLGVGANRGKWWSIVTGNVPPEPELDPRPDPLELSDQFSSLILKLGENLVLNPQGSVIYLFLFVKNKLGFFFKLH